MQSYNYTCTVKFPTFFPPTSNQESANERLFSWRLCVLGICVSIVCKLVVFCLPGDFPWWCQLSLRIPGLGFKGYWGHPLTATNTDMFRADTDLKNIPSVCLTAFIALCTGLKICINYFTKKLQCFNWKPVTSPVLPHKHRLRYLPRPFVYTG